MNRLSSSGLIALAEAMPERERNIVETTGQCRLVAGRQLERLYFSEIPKAASRARVARRVLWNLHEGLVLSRLERRIGGVRAGSAGHVYGLGAVGKRLLAYWRGEGLGRVRTPHEPGTIFVRHTLAVAEQYVQLIEAERAGDCELLEFEAEPDCWRQYVGYHGQTAILKPDAFVRLGVGEFEERSFLEVDLGTEGRGALSRKCRAYVAYHRVGAEQAEHGVFPRVVWLTTTEPRARLLASVVEDLPRESHGLFAVGTTSGGRALLTGSPGVKSTTSVYERNTAA